SGAKTVAVVDVGRVFKEYKLFESQLAAIKRDVKRSEIKITNARSTIEQLKRRAAETVPGSPQHTKLIESVAEQQKEIQARVAEMKVDFMNREARLYANTYRNVQRAVAEYARDNGIGIVLRDMASEINPADRDSVLKGVNRSIVFQDNADITDAVVEIVNSKAVEETAKGAPRAEKR
ncbi:MAG: OmpH family outer membrane protein, partial [Pirellulaceae bacterium]|nr:OmpH family outer membrane protein [Pirellulaceae bacterium]